MGQQHMFTHFALPQSALLAPALFLVFRDRRWPPASAQPLITPFLFAAPLSSPILANLAKSPQTPA
jgi:hypothetical protein